MPEIFSTESDGGSDQSVDRSWRSEPNLNSDGEYYMKQFHELAENSRPIFDHMKELNDQLRSTTNIAEQDNLLSELSETLGILSRKYEQGNIESAHAMHEAREDRFNRK